MIEVIHNINPSKVILYIDQLQDETLTHKAFHNKKYYAKISNNIEELLELTLAWELHKVNKKVKTNE